ncbi:set domain protein [Stylonychia lemnae]|uniref:Set domain protein n=1 Tax=Stylonychia lemnae TaxID=5949 RepID=A0A078AMY0_STYLE|nr:set domain protein [Stylonychia lemnae]|eukprot:CDW82727.1 set domain protein [Stylonychia lemnae]
MRFPAAFGDEDNYVVGSAAKYNIQPKDVIVYVPSRILITVEKALNSPIGFIFEKHSSIFKATEDRDYLILLLFVIYEHQKGTKSFWHPYFEAINPGKLTCFWEDNTIEEINDVELREQIYIERENLEEDWQIIEKLIFLYSKDHFNTKVCSYQLYQRCACFVQTRCFGWGLPTTFVAPIADCFNHNSTSNNKIDIVNKILHKANEDLYQKDFDFKTLSETKAERMNYNVKDLYSINRPMKKGAKLLEESKEDYLYQSMILSGNERAFQQYKELFESKQNLSSQQKIWEINFQHFELDQDNDIESEEKDSTASTKNENLRRKLLSDSGKGISSQEFDLIKNNTRLREVYGFRWWRDDDENNFLVIVNQSGKDIKAGEQIYYSYGRRSNSDLLLNYGFCLDENNQYNSMQFRLLKNPSKLKDKMNYFPDEKVKDSEDYYDLTLDIKIKSYQLNESLFEFARKQVYFQMDKEQSKTLSVMTFSQPFSLDFELNTIREIMTIIEAQATIDDMLQLDINSLQSLYAEEKDYRLKFVRLYNLERRRVYDNHMKLLKVLYLMVQTFKNKKSEAAKYLWNRVLSIEYQDSIEEIFQRRMGIKTYLHKANSLN